MIKVGEIYKCIKEVIDKKDKNKIYFYKGVTYKSIKPNSLEDNFSINHVLDNDFLSEHFELYSGERGIEEKVNHPSHYTWLKDKCNIEVIDITRYLDFDTGNAVKYLLRAGHKSEKGYDNIQKQIEDLKKAVWYINDKIKMLEDGREN